MLSLRSALLLLLLLLRFAFNSKPSPFPMCEHLGMSGFCLLLKSRLLTGRHLVRTSERQRMLIGLRRTATAPHSRSFQYVLVSCAALIFLTALKCVLARFRWFGVLVVCPVFTDLFGPALHTKNRPRGLRACCNPCSTISKKRPIIS